MKHRRNGVKREHSILPGFGPLFERLARLPGVGAVIPGRIARNPTHHPGLVLSGETHTGFKLLAKSTSSVQEVFLVAAGDGRAGVRGALQPLLTAPDATAHRPPATRQRRRRRPPASPAADWVPAAKGGRSSRSARAAPARLADQLADPAIRRRLLALRLRGVRWRRRFGNPLRRAPRRRR